MDIVSCVTAVASCITAIATAITVFVAINQFKKTLLENERHLEEERHLMLKDKACLVDVWIAIALGSESNKHVLIIENNSDAAIRDVRINCIWQRGDNSEAVGGPPLLRIVPRGLWLISRNYNSGTNYKWNLPESISRDELNKKYQPRFTKDKNHQLESFQFIDAHEVRWRREGDSCHLVEA